MSHWNIQALPGTCSRGKCAAGASVQPGQVCSQGKCCEPAQRDRKGNNKCQCYAIPERLFYKYQLTVIQIPRENPNNQDLFRQSSTEASLDAITSNIRCFWGGSTIRESNDEYSP